MKKYIIIGIVAIVMTPMLLNIFLGASNPFANINVVGEVSNWLGFYGSYIGGILTAIIGFITLHYSTKQNRLQLEIRSKEDALKELKLALSERIGLFNFSKVIEISLFPYDEKMYTIILRELNEYHYQLTSKANGWAVIYASSERPEIIKFTNAYDDCWREFDTNINSITTTIYILNKLAMEEVKKIEQNDTLDKEANKRKELIQNIETISNKKDIANSKILALYNAAQAWISAEEREIEELKKQL